jgi:beta-lactam-binding protein with PASTA domain
LDALSSRGLLRLLFIGLLLLSGVVLTFLTLRDYLEVDQIVMPDVTGLNYAQAYRELRALDLQVTSYAQNVVGAEVDSVTSQNPSAGDVVRRGRSVSIGVHSPPEDMRLPSFVGQTEASLPGRLADLGLELGEVSYEHSDQPSGTILAQSPQAEAVVRTGSRVSVVVSRGPELRTVAVPNVAGQPLATARERLQAAGFPRIELVPTGTSSSRSGVVNAQFPEPGQQVPLGSPITLYFTLSTREVVEVPALTSMTLQSAQLLLRSRGLEVGWVDYIDDPSKPSGVVSYRPTGYTLPGTPVVLQVNGAQAGANVLLPSDEDDAFDDPRNRGFLDGIGRGDPSRQDRVTQSPGRNANIPASIPEGARRIPFVFDPAAYGLSPDQVYQVRLVVNDDGGQRTLLDERLERGEKINTSVDIFANAQLQIYINDSLYTAWNPY